MCSELGAWHMTADDTIIRFDPAACTCRVAGRSKARKFPALIPRFLCAALMRPVTRMVLARSAGEQATGAKLGRVLRPNSWLTLGYPCPPTATSKIPQPRLPSPLISSLLRPCCTPQGGKLGGGGRYLYGRRIFLGLLGSFGDPPTIPPGLLASQGGYCRRGGGDGLCGILICFQICLVCHFRISASRQP